MTELKFFTNEEFGQIRIRMVNNEPWFVGKDVANALGYSDTNKAISTHVDENDKLNDKTASSLGQRGGWFINESGLYSLILSSKLPSAKRFKRWVTSEVLPSLRLNGGYIVNQENLTDEELMAKALIVAHHVIKNKNKIIEEQNQKLLEQEPKIEIYDKCINTENTYSMGEVARLLNFNKGRNDLFKRLREKHILMHNNIPYQRYTKYFDVKIRYNVHTEMNDITTRVKSCGVDFINKILKDDVDVNKLSLFD